MSDNDDLVLKNAKKAVNEIDRRYKDADLAGKLELKHSRDKAFGAYAAARLDLLEEGVIATDDDVKQMKKLREKVSEAAQTQQLVSAALGVAKFLVKFA